MKNVLFIGFALSTIFAISSCGCHKEVVNNETVRIEKETIHDTVIVVKADSSHLYGQLNCDSLGNIELTNTHAESGTMLNAPKVRIVDNKIYVDCESKAQELFLQWKEKYISGISTRTKLIQVPQDFSTWQLIQIWLGRIFIILLIVAAVALFVNYRLKQK
jgi:hypothetical protein